MSPPADVAGLRRPSWLPGSVIDVVAGGARRQESVAAGVKRLDREAGRQRAGPGDPGPRRRPAAGLARSSSRRGRGRGSVRAQRSRSWPWPRRSSGSPAAGSSATLDRAELGTAQTPQGIRRDLLERAWQAFPPGRPGDVHRRSRPAGGLYDPGPCRSRRSDEPQGDCPGGPRTGLRLLSSAEQARTPAPRPPSGSASERDGHPFGPGEPLALGGVTIRGQPPASTATPTATSPCTRSPTRSSAHAAWVTWGGNSRPGRRRRPGWPARSSWPRSSSGSGPPATDRRRST